MNRRTLLLAGAAGVVAVVPWPRAADADGRVWPPSAWSAQPAPCVRCGQMGECMAVVVGGWACATYRTSCAWSLPRPAFPPAWPVNVPPDWPVVPMPAAARCEHCHRRGQLALEWPEPGYWGCAPGVPGCWCDEEACCGRPDTPGELLHGPGGPLGVIRRIEGEHWPRRFLVERPDHTLRWYDDQNWRSWQ